MNKNLNLDPKALIGKAKKMLPVTLKHAPFIAIILILFIYLFAVWRISQLASAEPPAEAEDVAAAAIPKVNKNAINQIQALEQSNTQVHSLFDSARKNPFQE